MSEWLILLFLPPLFYLVGQFYLRAARQLFRLFHRVAVVIAATAPDRPNGPAASPTDGFPPYTPN